MSIEVGDDPIDDKLLDENEASAAGDQRLKESWSTNSQIRDHVGS